MNETVSKTTGGKATTAVEAPAPPVKVERKTQTNWRIFADSGFIPVRWRCEGYKGNHPADMSCHTAFPPTGENVLRHIAQEHGGGWFKIKFRISDSKKVHPLWAQLEEAGVELQEFYCPHCQEHIPVQPRRIIHHLQNHPGAWRVNLEPQTLCMELGFRRVDEEELGELYEQ